MEFKNNPLIKGASGMLGGALVFRTWNGKTFGSSRPKKPTKESSLQKETRTKFRRATDFAKNIVKDPAKKAEYMEIAKKLNITNAYTAAITEYMRKPEIEEVDTATYSGKANEEIILTVQKKGFDVQHVEVAIEDKSGKIIEEGRATRKVGNKWIYTSTQNIEAPGSLIIHIKIRERTNNILEKSLLIEV